MKPKKYEDLLRAAFGLSAGKEIGRWGDPARLANTDVFSKGNLSSVKIGTGYAIEIFNDAIINKGGLDDPEHDRLEAFPERVLSSADLAGISALIEEYDQTVVDKYFEYKEGVCSPK